jgi:hypothetical protein
LPNLVRAWSLPLPGGVDEQPGGVVESLTNAMSTDAAGVLIVNEPGTEE